MGRSSHQLISAVAIAAIVALFTAPIAGPLARACDHCPPQCPMHARGVGCHQGKTMGCHGQRSGLRLMSACSHAAHEQTSTATARAVLPARDTVVAVSLPSRVMPQLYACAAQLAPEPPTDPPRAFRA
ncbi:MAG: hypothetical protein HYR72_21770 [Deltaproteobacteria bacterium]|nr:hypothetical protein [Deltaproteobacteria bacterium]MBI3390147.1 hypothetical protein [Deltaproteobacteria bacterium]